MGVSFQRVGSKNEEYVLVNGKRYICLKKAKDEISKHSTNDKAYAEGMELLAWNVFVRGTVENNELFA